MEEEKNIPDDELSKDNRELPGVDKPSASGNEPEANSTTKSESENKKTEIKMEPHIHPHVHHEKKWKDYLFEFLMLFLAVSAGFFVENIRENYVEKHRAAVLAKSLYADLQYDTSKLNWTIRERKKNVSKNDSLLAELGKPVAEQNNVLIQRLTVSLLNTWYFERYSGTYEQVKNSGSLRYFPDSISNALTYYEQSVKQNVLTQNMEEGFISSTIKPFIYANVNFKYPEWQGNSKNDKRIFINSDLFFKEHLYGYVTYCLNRNSFLTEEFTSLRAQAIAIMSRLNEKYGIVVNGE